VSTVTSRRFDSGVQVSRDEASPRTLNPERLDAPPLLAILLVGSCIPLHPAFAQGWMETESRRPESFAGAVDVSGSMSGTKLEQAKSALQQALGTLGPNDRFRVITFSSAVRAFRDGPVAATTANLTDAREFVDGLAAEGGTNLAGALEAALDVPGDDGRLVQIILVSDGMPSVGEQAPDRIAGEAAARIGRARAWSPPWV
jgi:Mg-chelatase subunit ChlD